MSALPVANCVGIVLGAAVWPGGAPSPTLARRATHAADLYHAGIIDHILGCGGVGLHPPSEASVIAQICRDRGVPDVALTCEDRSTTTRENLSNAKTLLRTNNSSDLVIVTDLYHAPRAMLIACQIGLKAKPNCPSGRNVGPKQWFRHISRELAAIAATLLRIR